MAEKEPRLTRNTRMDTLINSVNRWLNADKNGTEAEKKSAFWNLLAEPLYVRIKLVEFGYSLEAEKVKVISKSYQLKSQAELEIDSKKKAQMLAKSEGLLSGALRK